MRRGHTYATSITCNKREHFSALPKSRCRRLSRKKKLTECANRKLSLLSFFLCGVLLFRLGAVSASCGWGCGGCVGTVATAPASASSPAAAFFAVVQPL